VPANDEILLSIF
jgi:hypothetical protein